ncbi:hypothetical protein DFX59_21950 [Escherichia coli]|nr:hypothetical protein [Escherichia coli]
MLLVVCSKATINLLATIKINHQSGTFGCYFFCFFRDFSVFSVHHLMHEFECALVELTCFLLPMLARFDGVHATALKPTHEAGGRGGESTARWRWC